MFKQNPYNVVRQLESALCDYTGARFAVAVNSCTMAILLAVAWHMRSSMSAGLADGYGPLREQRPHIEIPRRTYISVPMSIIHAGGWPTFRDEDWRGHYVLYPLPVYDCARWFTGHMFEALVDTMPVMACVSFHHSKILGDTQGGAILHNDADADGWLRRARFDGRTEGFLTQDDTFTQIGWHCTMSPDIAARLLVKLAVLPEHNEPLPSDPYPDLSQMDIFK